MGIYDLTSSPDRPSKKITVLGNISLCIKQKNINKANLIKTSLTLTYL